MSSYCVKCHAKTPNVGSHAVAAPGGRRRIASKCAKCGTGKSQFVSSGSGMRMPGGGLFSSLKKIGDRDTWSSLGQADTWKKIGGVAAPVVGGIAGGPLGGIAGKFVGNAIAGSGLRGRRRRAVMHHRNQLDGEGIRDLIRKYGPSALRLLKEHVAPKAVDLLAGYAKKKLGGGAVRSIYV